MVADLRRDAATALAAGNREEALASLSTALRLQPDDPDATALLTQLLETARRETAESRDQVPPTRRDVELFQEGDRLVSEAEGSDVAAHIRQLWTARTLFQQAAAAPPVRPAENVAAAPPPAANQTPPPRRATPPPAARVDAPPPAAPAVDPRAEVTAVLDRYRSALNALDAEAVRAVYPTVPEPFIEALAGFESYSATLDELEVQVTGETATASAHLRLQVQPRAGSAASAAGPARFELRRRGAEDWVIDSIDLSAVR